MGQWAPFLLCALLLLPLGCGSGPEQKESADIKRRLRADAFAIMFAMSMYAGISNKGVMLELDTDRPAKWWTKSASSKKLLQGVRYQTVDGIAGLPVGEFDPKKPFLKASGAPVQKAYKKAWVLVEGGLQVDPVQPEPPSGRGGGRW